MWENVLITFHRLQCFSIDGPITVKNYLTVELYSSAKFYIQIRILFSQDFLGGGGYTDHYSLLTW